MSTLSKSRTNKIKDMIKETIPVNEIIALSLLDGYYKAILKPDGAHYDYVKVNEKEFNRLKELGHDEIISQYPLNDMWLLKSRGNKILIFCGESELED